VQRSVENKKASVSVNSPLAVGLQEVRFIKASILFSTKQLNTAAAAATNQIPTQAKPASFRSCKLGSPGMAKTMPINAQKTIN
jgi:hypothetical protein